MSESYSKWSSSKWAWAMWIELTSSLHVYEAKAVVIYLVNWCSEVGASWCNLTDDVTTYPMMTSPCVIELIMLGLVYGLSDVCHHIWWNSYVSFHYNVIIVKLHQEPPCHIDEKEHYSFSIFILLVILGKLQLKLLIIESYNKNVLKSND